MAGETEATASTASRLACARAVETSLRLVIGRLHLRGGGVERFVSLAFSVHPGPRLYEKIVRHFSKCIGRRVRRREMPVRERRQVRVEIVTQDAPKLVHGRAIQMRASGPQAHRAGNRRRGSRSEWRSEPLRLIPLARPGPWSDSITMIGRGPGFAKSASTVSRIFLFTNWSWSAVAVPVFPELLLELELVRHHGVAEDIRPSLSKR